MITSGKPGILFSSEYARVSASSADLTLFSATKTGTPSCKSQRPRCGSLPMMREAVDQIVPPTWLSRRYTTRSPTLKVSCAAAFRSSALWSAQKVK